MPRYPLYQVDAFAEGPFTGNPAAVVPLAAWLPDETLLAIAEENNLSETAFFVPLPPESGADYHLRWFTPTFEIDLCGHATLASAWVAFNELGFTGPCVRFRSQSGPLAVTNENGVLTLDFPSWPPSPTPVTEEMVRAFGATPLEAHAGRDLLCVFADEDVVRGLTPDHAAFHKLPYVCNIASAPGKTGGAYDFVSRVFCPEVGVPEDPVTGSAHSLLTPFWAARLGKTRLRAWQASKRGGRLECELAGDRVRIAGRAALYLRGEIVALGR
ncbi:phenazine biosynthesis protein PhzF family [Humidesulfovibrio mexicanus]|uniref:Phenazine biosynthesis protein PhzF family n=1 Tax=Humidesulfovibrio mexicanus TaxID=147047 RepID=A0A238Y415_9BACT|nr:PhzF family phenazine biosynthesis protein [Humidesulfovibrio mexicanus]SNR65049.1 phenazine biosynthesis protein PhzF family [Humidesulfovibrio mexicanus]